MMYKNRPTFDFYGLDGVGFGIRPHWGIQEYVMDSFQLRIRELEEKLEIATKALKKYESAAGYGREAFLALKEIEEVKCGNNYIYISGR